MTRDPSGPPDEFVSFVERRLPSVSRSARYLTGDERLADEFARELFLPIARRWTWLNRIDTRRRQDPGSAADRMLIRQFRNGGREFAADRSVRIELSLEPVAWPSQRRGSVLTGPLSPADEAESLWDRAFRVGRRRLIVAGGLAVVGIAVLAGRPRGGGVPVTLIPTAEPETARPNRLPPGIDVLPSLLDQTFLPRYMVGAMPHDLDLRPENAIGTVIGHNTGRALAVFQGFENSPTLALGPDGGLRTYDLAHRVATTAVLSPDGLSGAFSMGNWVDILNFGTGQVRAIQSGGSGWPPIWLDSRRLMIGITGGSEIHDVFNPVSITPSPVRNDDVVVPQGLAPLAVGADPAERVRELLSIGQPVTAPARVRAYGPQFDSPTDVAITGELAGWIGRWRGVGFSFGGRNGLMVRRCQVGQTLPEGMGEVTFGIAVVSASTGIVLRLLLDTTSTGSNQTEVLGWLDQQTVLLSTGTFTALVLLAWRIDSGRIQLVSLANRGARVAFADLSTPPSPPSSPGSITPSA